MNTITQLIISSRVLTGSLFALAFVAGAVIVAPQAHAATQDITVSENLTVGMAGASVVTLQALLSEMGYLNVPTGVPFGYYGSLTKNAVARYQANLNVVPAVGYYGPITKVALFNDFSSHGWTRLLGWTL